MTILLYIYIICTILYIIILPQNYVTYRYTKTADYSLYLNKIHFNITSRQKVANDY
jgi:hypothetical protein